MKIIKTESDLYFDLRIFWSHKFINDLPNNTDDWRKHFEFWLNQHSGYIIACSHPRVKWNHTDALSVNIGKDIIVFYNEKLYTTLLLKICV